ncbi:hypothetical protein CQW23_21540 [Capsicum baccatum]|uniref:Uncharacterized protein n=1 Tax=Capsicum baccatum TaxID=33114 RepID=A0A2G2VYA3_CAPBA|nr:hypothetical protein CQW23_21540 [Capsicum baccatum]
MEVINTNAEKYDRKAELQPFDETKAGVKGLMDAAITKVPRIFVQPSNFEDSTIDSNEKFSFPIVDLDGISKEDLIKRKKIVQEVGHASETWGFFEVINHGIAGRVMVEMKDGVIRDILLEYTKQVMKLGDTLFELLSEAIGLEPNHLKDMGCSEGLMALGHYYPECPQPELTLGTRKNADNDFLTVLLQDNRGRPTLSERSHLERDKGGKADMVWTCEQKMHRCSSEDELEVGYSGCMERHRYPWGEE